MTQKYRLPMHDPTENVLKHVEGAVKRIDDLRVAETRRLDDLRVAEARRIDEQAKIRENYEKELRKSESERINSVRTIDINAVAIAHEKAEQQAAVLANQLSETITNFNTQQNTLATLFNDRIAKVERTQYESAGKTEVTDPMMSTIMEEIKSLRASRSVTTGEGAGKKELWYLIGGGIMMLLGIIGLVLTYLK